MTKTGLAFAYTLLTINTGFGAATCKLPSNGDVTINIKDNSSLTLYASVSEGSCVPNQPLVAFTKSHTFKLPINQNCGTAKVHYHVNVYEDAAATKPVAYIFPDLDEASSKKICPWEWDEGEADFSSNYERRVYIDSTEILLTLTKKQ